MDLEMTDAIELDLPPEYCRYKDEGCEVAASCLECPLPTCVYELPGGRQRWLKEERNREIARQFATKGKRIRELATAFGVSQRTVQRAIREIQNARLDNTCVLAITSLQGGKRK